MVTTDWIDNTTFEVIKNHSPIFSVDIVVYNLRKNILVMKRNDEPAKGEWWIPGGRVRKFESIVNAAQRKLLDETGLHLVCYSTGKFNNNIWENYHCPTAICYAKYNNGIITLDNTHSEYKWINPMMTEEKLDERLCEELALTGFWQ